MTGRTLAARTLLIGVLLAAAAPASAGAASQPYVPFVTDFAAPAADSSSGGNDWTTVGIGGGIGATLVALLAASALIVAHLSRKEQWR